MTKNLKAKMHTMKFCRNCGASYQMPEDAFKSYCYTCREEEKKKWYRNVYKPWFDSLPADKKRNTINNRYEKWKEWVSSHKKRRQQLSLASYHRNKAKRRARRNKARRQYYARTGK